MSENEFKASDFTILMVDDLPKNLQVLGSILKSQGYQVEFATNGKNALTWLEKRKFDLILLDLMMPEMDGFEVCQNIRKKDDFNDMPIIFLTAKVDKESLVRGFQLGGQDYISKPFDSSELLARVRTHLELRESKRKLKEVNNWLEKKVEERTEDLKLANDKLTEANKNLDILSKQLMSLDAEKTEFLQIISHEIRTPLNAIKGFLGLVKNKVKEEKALNYFNYIDEASYRLERFSIQALLITELRVKKYPVKKISIGVKEGLENLISTKFINTLNEKNISFKFDLPNENIEIKADKELFFTCVSNIIENAIRYSNLKGEILFKAYTQDNGVCLETLDQGPGFSKKALLKLHKLFVSGSDGFNEGKGLDLAVVHLIMENHGGWFEVTNNPAGGAIVKLFFPNAEKL